MLTQPTQAFKPVNRRALLKGSLQCLATTLIPVSWATALTDPLIAVGALRLPNGQFGVAALNTEGDTVWTTPLGARCHGGCFAPAGTDLVLFERRPGWLFHVLDSATGHPLFKREPEQGEHFYGHGVFSLDGRFLYATASHFESGQGRIAVFDTQREYRRTDTLALEGVGPHQLELSPDGSQLIIALGGIRTHPDYDRIKLNLNDMDPALLIIDRLTGSEISRHRPSDSQLSCRHLAIADTETTYVACQYQGPEWQQPPLIGRLQEGRWSEIRLPDRLQSRLHNYLASIAVQPTSDVVAITAPRGGLVVVLDGSSGQVLRDIAMPDVAGVKPARDGSFLVSSGTGDWLRLDPELDYAVGARGTAPWLWDNHLF